MGKSNIPYAQKENDPEKNFSWVMRGKFKRTGGRLGDGGLGGKRPRGGKEVKKGIKLNMRSFSPFLREEWVGDLYKEMSSVNQGEVPLCRHVNRRPRKISAGKGTVILLAYRGARGGRLEMLCWYAREQVDCKKGRKNSISCNWEDCNQTSLAQVKRSRNKKIRDEEIFKVERSGQLTQSFPSPRI